MITKEQGSDLRSLQTRYVSCAIEKEKVNQAFDVALRQLESFLWNLEHEKDTTKP